MAVVALLLKAKAQVNCQDGFGETALCRAARTGHADTVAMLIHEGKDDMDVVDREGRAPLIYAALHRPRTHRFHAP